MWPSGVMFFGGDLDGRSDAGIVRGAGVWARSALFVL